ncbi:cilia- and flagella-associated protein HOATZ isoform X3 [Bufo gargarizans]|uniref:cilia- and flagella-associated protein HOATZ isoform X3 n=1 Tax=Bufo gargarizans TaxID=30331 RepID=UPI001CF450F3|nr:cilia- and flagella-associated protein HOATZ isoform X3 [Bufo gargarizans]
MEEPGDNDYTVFVGSSEQDVMCSKIFWNSVTLQPPLESRLVSGDVEQRLRAAGGAKPRKNYTGQELEDLKTEYFLLEAQRLQDLEQRSIYMQKKELILFGHEPNIPVEDRRLPTPDMEEMEDIKAVRQLE